MASPESCLHLLAGVSQEVDRFLDPARPSTKRALSPPAESESRSAKAKGETGDIADCLKLCGLSEELASVRAVLAKATEEAQQQRYLQRGREAESVEQLKQRCANVERERQEAEDRADQAKQQLLEVEVKYDELRLERGEHQAGARQRKEELQTRKGHVATSGEGGSTQIVALETEAEALRSRIVELEGEVNVLHVSLKEGAPDRALSAQLQEKHAREAQRELAEAHQQVTHLKAALQARSAALREAEETLRCLGPVKRDLEAFMAAAGDIVVEARQGHSGDASEGAQVAAITPTELSLAWASLQTELSTTRRDCAQARQDADSAGQQERSTKLELGRAHNETAAIKATSEELRLELRAEKDEVAAQKARGQVLREAVTKATAGEVDAAAIVNAVAAADVQVLTTLLTAAQEQVRHQAKLLQGRQQEAAKTNQQFERVQAGEAEIVDLKMKVGQLERLNSDLWTTMKDLEQQQERLTAEVEQRDAQMSDLDQATTKLLHLKQGPGGKLASGSLGGSAEKEKQWQALEAENVALRDQLGRGGGHLSAGAVSGPGDLEHRQAARQLDRFKKATRKYVQDFREGIFSLLGWKVEMKGEGCAMRWHLTSSLHDEELVFQLRPAEAGKGAEFDLLSTDWAERLQEDRQAMAYLEVYGSIPGFLGAVTTELLEQKAL